MAEKLQSLLVLLFVLILSHEGSGKRGFVITSPRVYRVGGTEKLTVNLVDIRWTGNVTVMLRVRDKVVTSTSGVFEANKPGVLLLRIPLDVKPATDQSIKGNLLVRVNYRIRTRKGWRDSALVVFRASREVTIRRSENIIIQTDKPVYKPGQTVRMRVIGISYNLRPLKGKVERITISNPSNVRMMQWDNVNFVDGIVSLQMPLSKEPVLGEWKIKAKLKSKEISQMIVVRKYVLPKFRVTIQSPPSIVLDEDDYSLVTATVCARYMYDQPVIGELEAAIEVHKKVTVSKKLTDGCADLEITSLRSQLGVSRQKKGKNLRITAVVKEASTGVSHNATSVMEIVPFNSLKLEFSSDTPTTYKPGLPFYGKIKISLTNGPPFVSARINIQATLQKGPRVFYQDLYVGGGLQNFVIPRVRGRSRQLIIKVKQKWSDNQIIIKCRPWYSPTNSFLLLDRKNQPLKVGREASLSLKYTEKGRNKKHYLQYVVVCSGSIVLTGSHRASGIGRDTIRFHVTQTMVPGCRILVQYIRPENGEVVADSAFIDVEDKLENQVKIRFDNRQRRPGDVTQLIVSAARGSTVAVAVVDKSVHLLRDARQLTKKKVVDILTDMDVGPEAMKQCKKLNNKASKRGEVIKDGYYGKYYYTTDYEDTTKATNDAGVIIISNFDIETRKCRRLFKRNRRVPKPKPRPWGLWRLGLRQPYRNRPFFSSPLKPVRYRFSASRNTLRLRQRLRQRPKQKRKLQRFKQAEKKHIRENFPETWIWTEYTVSNVTGEKIIRAQIPDTITSWYASAFAMSESSGMGVASPASLTAFQPFFVSLTLPYSVVRGEKLTFTATVFNYMNRCTQIQLELKQTNDIRLTSSSLVSLNVCGNKAASANFTIIPQKLGRVPLTVTSRASSGAVDIVRRKLLVEPEGVRKEYTYSELVCLNRPTGPSHSGEGSQDSVSNQKINLTLPTSIVRGSAYAVISAIGDVMGPALSDLHKLLRLPTGCGEQNMVKFSPNVYVMQYLENTQQLTERIRNKAVDFLRTGYQRELTYKRKDGSYSAFGDNDQEGSMWLTAFVVKSFAQARPFIFIDPVELEDTIKWITNKQKRNGCFQNHGRLLNKALKGGVSGSVTLTAFVAAALMEAGTNATDRVIQRALRCIVYQKDNIQDSYSSAIVAHAFTLAKHAYRFYFVGKLKTKAVIKDGLIYWQREPVPAPAKSAYSFWTPPYKGASPIDIEMTSYALMAYLGTGSSLDLAQARDIVRWLSSQRNGLGGFRSTQDTCVALQSLSQFASRIYGESHNMTVDIRGAFNHSFTVNKLNSMVLQTVEVPSAVLPLELELNAKGRGCALVQADVSFNVPVVDEEPAFNLSVSLRKHSVPLIAAAFSVNDVSSVFCNSLEMNICARWLRDGASNMAVIQVKLVSGFVATEDDLNMLKNRVGLGLKRYDIEGQNVILYFDKIKSMCFSFGIFQTQLVRSTKPAPVTVYDYYEPDLSATVFYQVEDELCGVPSM